jgi:hypothetical protein
MNHGMLSVLGLTPCVMRVNDNFNFVVFHRQAATPRDKHLIQITLSPRFSFDEVSFSSELARLDNLFKQKKKS